MDIVLSAPHLAGPGGVQTYLLTVAPHLERLGHEVILWAPEQGETAARAVEIGLRVAETQQDLPARCDAVLAQDGATSLDLAARYPDAVRAIVVHGADFDLHLPAQLPGAVNAAVVMNATAEKRMRATSTPVELVRLRQPIDLARFRAARPISARPRRVLLLGNYLNGPRRDALVAACLGAGLECSEVGRHGTPRLDPRSDIARADIVVGQGRSLLEAMACGRAAWSFGTSGGDGWVTAATYPAMEADGFRGRSNGKPAGDFAAALRQYTPDMGTVNRELVVEHHSAFDHANELMPLLARLGRFQPPGRVVALELARLKRSEYAAVGQTLEVARELREARSHARSLEDRVDDLEAQVALEHARFEEVLTSRRWRTAKLLASPLDRLRRKR